MDVVITDAVLLLVLSLPADATDEPTYDLKRDATGRLLALAYTSPEELGELAGPHQPWLAVPAASLRLDLERLEVDALEIGRFLKPHERWTEDGPPTYEDAGAST